MIPQNMSFENNNNGRIAFLMPLLIGIAFFWIPLFIIAIMFVLNLFLHFTEWGNPFPVAIIFIVLMVFGLISWIIGKIGWEETSTFIKKHNPEYDEYFKNYNEVR
jgi:hypothetical protein